MFHKQSACFATAIVLTLATPHTTYADDPTPETLDRIRNLNPHLIQSETQGFAIKVWALSQSEYGFFRGSADLFYEWCFNRCDDWLQSGNPRILLHGDIHLGNMGTYQSHGKPGKDIHFGVVDLDETFEGPAQLDILRAAVTLRFLAADRKFSVNDEEWTKVMNRLCSTYKAALQGREKPSELHKAQRIIDELVSEARSSKPRKYLKKYCDLDRKRFRPVRIKKGRIADIMQRVSDDERGRVISAMWGYLQSSSDATRRILARVRAKEDMQAAVLDVARWIRLGSSGSQGLRKYLVLIETGDTTPKGLLILQMKEEPIPAAGRASMNKPDWGNLTPITVSKKDSTRGAFVAEAYANLLRPAKWMIGHAQIGETGFLVKPKDPWGEEPSTKMFRTKADLDTAASLLGTILGRSHRNATADSPTRDAIRTSIATNLDSNMLASRSAAVAAWLMERYEDLRRDPAAQDLVKQAETYLKETERIHSKGKNP